MTNYQNTTPVIAELLNPAELRMKCLDGHFRRRIAYVGVAFQVFTPVGYCYGDWVD